MNKKAIYGVLIAVLLPFIGYLAVRGYSERAVAMPRHYIFDSVVTVTKSGKEHTDTVWHKLPDFTMTNQLGQKVTWNDLNGKIVVANFFFTHCPTICPGMTLNIKKLQQGIKSSDEVGNREANFVQFLSFSIDPERDSVTQLKKWQDKFQLNPQNWWLLTGDRKAIYDLSINDMKLMAQDGGPIDSNFLHTDYAVLIDKNRNIRGYYHTLDTTELVKLTRDIIYLSLEKDPKNKSVLAGNLELIMIVFVVAALGLVILFNVLKKENRRV
jgi:protein SCO1/2